jgi:hypothetical protein
MRWSSEPEASSRPDVDQLRHVSYSPQIHAQRYGVPQSIDATVVAFQLIDDIQTLYPLSVAVDASNVRVLFAMLPKLPLEQAVVYCVLHACVSRTSIVVKTAVLVNGIEEANAAAATTGSS